ncbi:hypothetical protein SteCoe_26493 [Stentor coeruleus]|uniref:Uncharacterized protein n=1 Tax=Stentor coeruleus TaxID=5963 RepID=A0A1R2BCQ5_9CILI|nr:hypothetical protein SteCoe_26493 [Stentor coeruleus]
MNFIVSIENLKDSIICLSDRETEDSIASSPVDIFTKHSTVFIPKHHANIFRLPSESSIKELQKLSTQILKILEILDETVPVVNIRDEMSMQNKKVILQMPVARRTIKRPNF